MTEAEIARFIYREARLLDEKRWDAWYELFTEDGHYWVPLTRNQPDAEFHTSLAYEDKLLLRLRIERLRRRPPSQHPESWSQHVLQAPEIESFGRRQLADAHGVSLCGGAGRRDADADRRGVASSGAAGWRVADSVEAGEPAELRRGTAVDPVVFVDKLSLQEAKRRSNPLREKAATRQTGDCFAASLLIMTGGGDAMRIIDARIMVADQNVGCVDLRGLRRR